MSDLSKLGKGDMSATLYLTGVAVLGVGSVGAFLYLLEVNHTMVTMCVTLATTIGLSMLLMGLAQTGAQFRALRQALEDVERAVQMAAMGGEKVEQAMKQDAAQMLSSISTYIEMEMWVEAYKKAEELIAKYPKGEEAKKVKPNLDHIKSKAQQKPAAKSPTGKAPQQAPAQAPK